MAIEGSQHPMPAQANHKGIGPKLAQVAFDKPRSLDFLSRDFGVGVKVVAQVYKFCKRWHGCIHYSPTHCCVQLKAVYMAKNVNQG